MGKKVIASGTVEVKQTRPPGREWEEIVEVFEEDLEDTTGEELAVEDIARRVARNQAGEPVEVVGVDID